MFAERRGTIKGNDTRLDVRARGFWRHGQNAYFDIRVPNPNSAPHQNISVEKVLKKHEQEKKLAYNERVMNIEHGTFRTFVFIVQESVGKECEYYHKHLADKIATKTGDRYAKVLTFIRRKIYFLVLRSALLCLRR